MANDLNRRDFLASAAGAAVGIGAAIAQAPGAEAKNESPRRTILVIGAHMDDCEIGAGGLIAKAVRKGHRVVLVNVASNYSTWRVTKGREKQLRERVAAKAREMGAEKRFLEFGYQQVAEDLAALRRIAEVVVEVKPDVTLVHDRNERERAPSDHSTVGSLSERAVRNADTILGGLVVRYGREVYAFETYPQRDFRPDVFIDIGDVLKPVTETIRFFDRLYGESPYSSAGEIKATIKIQPDNEELPLTRHAEMKLAVAQFRGAQSGLRFAEAYRAVEPAALGARLLEQIVK